MNNFNFVSMKTDNIEMERIHFVSILCHSINDMISLNLEWTIRIWWSYINIYPIRKDYLHFINN
jgi:hypothetical protein